MAPARDQIGRLRTMHYYPRRGMPLRRRANYVPDGARNSPPGQCVDSACGQKQAPMLTVYHFPGYWAPSVFRAEFMPGFLSAGRAVTVTGLLLGPPITMH